MMLAPGTRLGPYEILAPLGAGGMGEVYRAHDSRLARQIAVKVLPAALASDPERLARFEHEARTVAGLNHPNIVVLHSIEESGGIRFLTMELVEGQSLDREVTPDGLPLPRVLELAIPLADALEAAHARGVVHRDLKPANVMVNTDGRVKVLDFGLAKLTQAKQSPGSPTPMEATQAATIDSPLSVAGLMQGTVPYMAPEQVRGEPVDARTDLFAFGVILFELATGQRPFTGKTLADVSSSILRDTPEPLERLRPDFPGGLCRTIARCLEKDRDRRFETAREVRDELDQVRRMMNTQSAPSSPSTASMRSASAAALAPVQDIASIAVLPFVNLSRDAEDEYFSDGLAEELLSMLAKIDGLRVAARTSSFHFKGKNPTIAEVGRALNVASVLEGSVRKAGNRVRISVQLVKVSDGYRLWSETYEKMLEDIFAVQDEVARAVVAALPGELLISKGGPATRAGTRDSAAYDAYLEGRFFWNKRTEADLTKAIQFFKQALARDPDFAEAWAGLADAYVVLPYFSLVPTGEVFPKSREAAHRALALRPGLGAAHATLAYSSMIDLQWSAAEAEYRRAIELSPDDATAHKWYADLLMMTGRSNAAFREVRRALELDPLSSNIWVIMGEWYWFEGQYEQAMAHYQKSLELTPTLPLALELAGRLCWQRGDVEQYFELRERLEAVSPRIAVVTALLREAYSRGGRSEVLRLQLSAPLARALPSDRARWHAELGEMDAAFGDLDDSFAQREMRLPYITYFADFAPLWKDPRFAALRKRMGLE